MHSQTTSKPVFAGVLGNVSQDLGWTKQANCKNMDIDLFFPELGQNMNPFAKEICDSCNVKVQCLWFANENSIEHGVFGGMSVRGRRDWRQENNVSLSMSYDEWKESR